MGSGGPAVERRTLNRGDGVSIPPAAAAKLKQFRSPHLCLCLSEESLKAARPFYLVSMPREVKVPTQVVNVSPFYLVSIPGEVKDPTQEVNV